MTAGYSPPVCCLNNRCYVKIENSTAFAKAVEFFVYHVDQPRIFHRISARVCGESCGKCGKLVLRNPVDEYASMLCKLLLPISDIVGRSHDSADPVIFSRKVKTENTPHYCLDVTDINNWCVGGFITPPYELYDQFQRKTGPVMMTSPVALLIGNLFCLRYADPPSPKWKA